MLYFLYISYKIITLEAGGSFQPFEFLFVKKGELFPKFCVLPDPSQIACVQGFNCRCS